MTNYVRDMTAAIAARLRQVSNPPSSTSTTTTPFKLPATAQDDDVARKLYLTLQSGHTVWKDLHEIVKTLWSAPDPILGEGADSTYLLSFLAAAAVKKDGSLMNAKQLVTMIAHLKYGARAFCMVEADRIKDRYGGSILE